MSTEEHAGVVEPAAPSPNRRERRRRELRDRVYAAAIELFVTRGFEATTMDAIADEADVARATVFNYFPQKVAFLEEWGVRRRTRVTEDLDHADLATADPATRLARYLRELAHMNEEARAESIILMNASTHQGRALQDPALATELANLIREGQQAGIYRKDADATRAGHLLSAGYFATVTRWTEEPPPFDLTTELDSMLRIVTVGLTVSS